MGIYRIKPWFQRTLQPITDWLVKRQVHPDWLTYGGVVVSAVMGATLIASTSWRGWLVIVPVGALVRTALNALDGQVSRRLGHAGEWGEVKNELSDRVADALIFGAIAFVPFVPLYVSVPGLIVTLLTGYIGILSKAVTGVREYGGVMGKPDRMATVAGGAFLVLITAWWAFMSAALVVIVVLGLVTITVRLRAIYARS